MPARRRTMRGKGPSLSAVKDFVKEKKLISDGLKLLDNSYANTASGIAAQLGYGKRKRARKQRGAGLGDVFSGLGTGIGSAAFGLGSGLHSLFGGRKRKGIKNVIKV